MVGAVVMRLDVARDGVFEFGNGFEDAAPDSSARDRREKPFDGVEPGGGRRGEVEGPSWMRGEPFQDIGMFVRGVIVDDGVNELAAWHRAAADSGSASDFGDRQTLRRKENDARPLHMFERTITVAGNGEQALAIFGCETFLDSLSHAP